MAIYKLNSNSPNKDMIEDEQYFRVTDETSNPYRVLPVDAWASEVDFQPTANPQKLTIDERRQNLAYLLQTMSQFISASPTPININAEFILKEVAKTAGFNHPEQIVSTGPTTLFQTPDGQVFDQNGQPPQIQPVDENGEPVQAQPGMLPDGSQG